MLGSKLPFFKINRTRGGMYFHPFRLWSLVVLWFFGLVVSYKLKVYLLLLVISTWEVLLQVYKAFLSVCVPVRLLCGETGRA